MTRYTGVNSMTLDMQEIYILDNPNKLISTPL